MSKKSEDTEKIISWVLYGLRISIGDTNIRNRIIQCYLDKEEINDILLGKTYTNFKENDVKNMIKDLKRFQKNKKYKDRIILFTASNLPDSETLETHYQSYIIDNKNNQLYMIDPARKPDGSGIYAPYISDNTIKPLFKESKYKVQWIKTTDACQINENDVFCQTWSLLLQLNSLVNLINKKDMKIKIPKNQDEKYKLLLKFYQTIANCPLFCKDFKFQYKKAFTKFIKEELEENIKKDLETYSKKDPCEYLTKMKVKDMY